VRTTFDVDQHVRRLQITIEDFPRVRVLNRLGGLRQKGDRGAGVVLERGEPLCEVVPFHQLHT
jgi:hypothetical protein